MGLGMTLVQTFAIGQELEWKNKLGQPIKAEFVSVTNDSVSISMKGKAYVLKLADLSPESQALAKKLGEMTAEIERLERANKELQVRVGQQQPPAPDKQAYTVAELKPILLRRGTTKQKVKQLFGPPGETAEEGRYWIYRNKVIHPDTTRPVDLYIRIQMGQATGFNYDDVVF